MHSSKELYFVFFSLFWTAESFKVRPKRFHGQPCRLTMVCSAHVTSEPGPTPATSQLWFPPAHLHRVHTHWNTNHPHLFTNHPHLSLSLLIQYLALPSLCVWYRTLRITFEFLLAWRLISITIVRIRVCLCSVHSLSYSSVYSSAECDSCFVFRCGVEVDSLVQLKS